MMNSSLINWQKLAEIKELKDYFNDDFQEFKNSICHYLKIMAKMTSTSIQEIAIIRALEVTNGCTQHSYRRNDSDCLSVEQTRECMKLSISSIRNQEIILKNGDVLEFSPETKELMTHIKTLYMDAFKNNIASQEKEFYAFSTAQFLACGKEKIDYGFQVVKDNYQDLFTDTFINKGIKYIEKYLEAIKN
ncbi:hypothetical protein WEU38_02920 [Cyanobacterium aponinum AL20118]|uniref:Uncharacterized protein n=1 Tax=Cyanobacterium aponinum AL20115 TaxID=3090662 RepID=A0AAF0ZFL7_9CHRO|nr:hypothetical protein [Cyanobacterium aponinum]WPF89247.1 hypothetical protein SAY89_02935 [Cyanobacterium aponinum AL20115]